jgi:hypothetical protein
MFLFYQYLTNKICITQIHIKTVLYTYDELGSLGYNLRNI